MSKHTAGPWTAWRHTNAGRDWKIDGREFTIATGINSESDARLIAQAPAMLELLKKIAPRCRNSPKGLKLQSQIVELIKLATGGDE